VSNMSYCRFQNTLPDLADCYDNIGDEPESEEEQRARVRLIRLCVKIAKDYAYVVEDAEEAERLKKKGASRG